MNEEAKKAFEQAINHGRLSDNEAAWNFAGNYMYMGRWEALGDNATMFKNIYTREYIA